MSELSKHLRSRLTGRLAPNTDRLYTVASNVEPVPNQSLQEVRVECTISGFLYERQTAPDDERLANRQKLAQLVAKEVFGEFFGPLMELERAILEMNDRRALDIVAKIKERMFES